MGLNWLRKKLIKNKMTPEEHTCLELAKQKFRNNCKLEDFTEEEKKALSKHYGQIKWN